VKAPSYARAAVLGIAFTLALVACGRTERLEPCNIAHEDCQADIYYAVMRARGDGWDPFDGLPPIQTITLAQYARQLKADAKARAMAAQPDPEVPKLDPWTVALQLLGLVAPTATSGEASVESRVSNVAAFYSSTTGKVTVLDRGDVHDDRRDTTLLAHELVHAFQDNEVSGTIGGDSNDGSFTGRAQIEGEAVLYEHLVGAELDGYEPQQADWAEYYRSWRDGLRDRMAKEASPFYAANWFVYPFGGGLMTKAWLEGGNAAVRELGSTFPRHASQLMQTSDGQAPSPAASLTCAGRPTRSRAQASIASAACSCTPSCRWAARSTTRMRPRRARASTPKRGSAARACATTRSGSSSTRPKAKSSSPGGCGWPIRTARTSWSASPRSAKACAPSASATTR
jgi:hypothetical protein